MITLKGKTKEEIKKEIEEQMMKEQVEAEICRYLNNPCFDIDGYYCLGDKKI